MALLVGDSNYCRSSLIRRMLLSHFACARAVAVRQRPLYPKSCLQLPDLANKSHFLEGSYSQDMVTVGPSATVPGIAAEAGR